nr:immunoglobulin heavy chain junction region [Macaca mulatta]MOV42949.1 immunoglobulin heavy chain junction region [Macaca mulatta]
CARVDLEGLHPPFDYW